MIVMKFGGTSVQDAAAFRNVAEIVTNNLDRRPLVVVSACAGVTDELLSLAANAASGKAGDSLQRLDLLRQRHERIAEGILQESREEAVATFAKDYRELRRMVEAVAAVRETPARVLDHIATYGELWSSLLLARLLEERGIEASLFDVRSVMITDDGFTRAAPLDEIVRRQANELIAPSIAKGVVVVTQGFLGATPEGVTTTLGRGGSDYSAAILGSVLNAQEIQIWTDVDGIMTADPSIFPQARSIEEMSFTEASELAYFGSRVLHPSTILPAIRNNIPVRVLNSRRPASRGTLIQCHLVDAGECCVKSIAYKEGITVITLQSTRMLLAHGFLARVFGIFERYKKSIDVVATSEVGISMTLDHDEHIEQIVPELRTFAEVRVERGKTVVCLVGEGMKLTRGIAGRVFGTLGRAGVNIELISHGGSDINLTFVIDESAIKTAVASLHSEFFPEPDEAPRH